MDNVVPLVAAPGSDEPSGPGDAAGLALRAAQAGIGAVALALGTLAEIVRQAADFPEDEPGETKEGSALVAGAALGFATEALRTTAALIDAGVRVARPVAVAGGAAFAPLRRVSEDLLRRWDETWETERPDAEAVAGAVASEATRRAVDAVLDQLDLTAVVLDRVELDRIVATLDIDDIAGKIDVDAIVARVDLDEVAARIDIAAIIERIDLSALALDVIERIDLPEIIRASTGTVASDAVRGVRMDSVAADRAVARFVDRLLGRHSDEDEDRSP